MLDDVPLFDEMVGTQRKMQSGSDRSLVGRVLI